MRFPLRSSIAAAAFVSALAAGVPAESDMTGIPASYAGPRPAVAAQGLPEGEDPKNVVLTEFPEVPPALAAGESSDPRDLVTDYLGGITSTERTTEDQRIAFARLFYAGEPVREYLNDLIPRARFTAEAYRGIEKLFALWDREAELEAAMVVGLRRSTYFASSRSENGKSLGDASEFAGNPPRPTPSFLAAPANAKEKLRVVVRTNDLAETWRNERGFALYVINDSGEAISVPGINGQFRMVEEAFDEGTGEWAGLEGSPANACNNTTHPIHAGRGECWKFAVPEYDGDVTAHLRVRLVNGEETILSNEFTGKLPAPLLDVARQSKKSAAATKPR